MCRKIAILLILFLSIAGMPAGPLRADDLSALKLLLVSKYACCNPGPLTMPFAHRLNTEKKAVALTFDACGGKRGSGYNKELIDYLIAEGIPATLFLSGGWIDANRDIVYALSKQPLFEIENHGYSHKIASVNGQRRYGLAATGTIGELVDEIELNARKIAEITGWKPRYYRSGGALYDRTALNVIADMGYQAVNGNAAAFDHHKSVSAERMVKNILATPQPSIVILHMNHRNWKERDALRILIPRLKREGYEFVTLKRYGVIEK